MDEIKKYCGISGCLGAGSNAFVISPKEWVESTDAIGIFSKSGRYGGRNKDGGGYYRVIRLFNIGKKFRNTMDIQQKYREEFNKDVYSEECCMQPSSSYSDEYVRWLEEQVKNCS